jgi:2,4-dienoyl-CoA reductase-like NADH-dependent reductase (Old Yellow Enzyme family)
MFSGTENPEREAASARTQAREAYFLSFARDIRARFSDVPLMVTGGFRSRQAMEAAVRDGDCDLIGLARPAVLNPSLPLNTIFNPAIRDEEAVLYARRIYPSWLLNWLGLSIVGGGTESVSAANNYHETR